MQLSHYSDYALRILMALAAHRERMTVDEIARKYGISRNHLAKVAQDLQGQGFLRTTRGRGGGMELAHAPEEIRVGDIIRRFERLDGFVECFAAGAGCAVDGPCGLKPALSQALRAFLAALDDYCLADLVSSRSTFIAKLAG